MDTGPLGISLGKHPEPLQTNRLQLSCLNTFGDSPLAGLVPACLERSFLSILLLALAGVRFFPTSFEEGVRQAYSQS